jgi:hypothetical protein
MVAHSKESADAKDIAVHGGAAIGHIFDRAELALL